MVEWVEFLTLVWLAGRRFESYSGQYWKALSVYPVVNEYLTIIREGLLRRKKRIGHRLPDDIAQDTMGL